jgi:hypothetical protein
MALIFQYGSNALSARLNSPTRLRGQAVVVGRAQTVNDMDIAFDVPSRTNGCAASDLVPTPGRKAWGVLYEVAEEFVRGRRSDGHKTLAQIEGERYEEKSIRISDEAGVERDGITFLVKERERRQGIATSAAYVSWIIYGLRGQGVPESYLAHVVEVAIATNQRALQAATEDTRLINTL